MNRHIIFQCNFPLPHVFPQPPFPLKREPTASAPRGATLGTRMIGTFLSLCHFACVAATQQNATHSRTFRQARHSIFSPPCGSCSVFEISHNVYKLHFTQLARKQRFFARPAYLLYVTGGKIYVDAAIRRLVLVVEACDAGKNLTFKELQGRAATR